MVRENNEGEYSEIGRAALSRARRNEMAIQQAIFTRRGVERMLRYAFEAATGPRGHVTAATKSNGISITMPFFDEIFREVGKEYPDVEASLSATPTP